jgi:hypothetical protein
MVRIVTACVRNRNCRGERPRTGFVVRRSISICFTRAGSQPRRGGERKSKRGEEEESVGKRNNESELSSKVINFDFWQLRR